MESVFVNTIPIASKKLLDFMDIQGIGYEEIDELKTIDLDSGKASNDYGEFIMQNYSYEEIGKQLVQRLKNAGI